MELKEGYKAVVLATPKTRNGNAAAIEPGSARWSSSDPSVVSIEQDPTNELGATMRGIDGSANESVVIELRADGDRGEGIKEIVGTLAVVCTQGDAATFDLEVHSIEDDDAPAEQPEPAPADTADNSDAGTVTNETEVAEDAGDAGSPGLSDNAEDSAESNDEAVAGASSESDTEKGEDEPNEIGGTPAEEAGDDANLIAGGDVRE